MSNDMLPGLFDDQLGITQTEQTLFDYEQVPVDRRGFVLQKTAETQWLLKRTTEDIVRIGNNLNAVKEKLPHGMFGKWLECEFAMSHRNATHFMTIADRLGDKLEPGSNLDLGMKILRELAAPSTPNEVIEGVQSGQIAPTIEAIKEAKLEARLAKEAERRAHADAMAYQQQLFNAKDAAQAEIDELTRQMDALKQELETATTPEVEIREVEKEVVPQSVTNALETFQKQINDLKTALETEKSAIPPEVQRRIDNLQKQADKLKKQEEENALQQERIDRLNNELRAAVRDSIASENDERIRQDWRTITSETRSCMMRLLGQWPTPLDIRSFESDDYERLSQLKSTLKRVLEECDALNYGGDDMVVNEQIVEEPIGYIESSSPYRSYTRDDL